MHTASQALAIERQASAQPSLAERVSRPKTRAILGLMRLNFLSVVATLPDDVRARLQRVSLDAFRALRVRDYGRVDLRMTEGGEIYVLEVNASPYLEKADEFATAARAAGVEYDDLIQRIVELAVARHR